MNASLKTQLAAVRVTLFGSARPARARRAIVRELVQLAVAVNTASNMHHNSVTVRFPF